MATKIKKAVIPAAGFGTRMLPATKTVPKEILPLAEKPAIQYLVEEAVASGITDIIVITSRGKQAIEDYFDYSPDIDARLRAAGRAADADELRAYADMANVMFIRQKEMRGLGHAILTAKPFVGDEPFAVLLGDDIIMSEKPVTAQLADAYAEFGGCVVGVQEVSEEQIVHYDSMKLEPIRDRLYRATDVREKPKLSEIFTRYSILGRYILPPEIFPILETLPPGHGGEIQLTDAIAVLCRAGGTTAVDFEGTRYDTGSVTGYLRAQIEISLRDEKTGAWLREYLRELAQKL
jgi:UTP--glucose-1-phosphate uridylyltransferase